MSAFIATHLSLVSGPNLRASKKQARASGTGAVCILLTVFGHSRGSFLSGAGRLRGERNAPNPVLRHAICCGDITCRERAASTGTSTNNQHPEPEQTTSDASCHTDSSRRFFRLIVSAFQFMPPGPGIVSQNLGFKRFSSIHKNAVTPRG